MQPPDIRTAQILRADLRLHQPLRLRRWAKNGLPVDGPIETFRVV